MIKKTAKREIAILRNKDLSEKFTRVGNLKTLQKSKKREEIRLEFTHKMTFCLSFPFALSEFLKTVST